MSFKINPNSGSGPDWASAVQLARARNEASKINAQSVNIVDYLNSVMNKKKPLYSSVSEAVADYRKKVGLDAFNIKTAAESIIAVANEEIPELFIRFPQVESYVKNVMQAEPFIQLPAMMNSIIEMFGREGIKESDLDDKEVIIYINDLMGERKKTQENYGNLGKTTTTPGNDYQGVRDSNRDPFAGLMPSNRY